MSAIFTMLWGLLKRYSSNKTDASRNAGHERQGTANWPGDLPRVGVKEFLVKWGGKTARSIFASRTDTAVVRSTREFFPRASSPKVAALFNQLYWPFFCSGIVMVTWFVVDVVLGMTMSVASYRTVTEFNQPILALLAPTAVGFWTNWLAIKMLFQPRRPNAVWWGLVPARRSQIVDGIAEGVLKRLISPEIVRDYLHRSGVLKSFVDRAVPAVRETIDDADFRREMKGLVYGLVHDFANSDQTRDAVETMVRNKIHDWTGETLGKKVVEWTKPLWGPVVLAEVVKALPEIPRAMDHAFDRIDQLLNKFPQWIELESETIERTLTSVIVEGLRNLDIRRIVKTQLDKMDERELERMLTGNVTTELRFIQTSGGVFGFLAGIAFLFPASRPLLLLIGLLLWLVYRLTARGGAPSERRASPD